ncbi:MAG: hypothetical protein Kow0099_38610 [Candidatus Abyssubacteria bacterium]
MNGGVTMTDKARNTLKKISVGTALGAPVGFAILTNGGSPMDPNSAFAFTVGVSLFCMFIIMGAALMGAYRFLKNVGLFKGHYYY